MRRTIVVISTCILLLGGIGAWAQSRLPGELLTPSQPPKEPMRRLGQEPSVISGQDIGIRLTGSVDATGRVQGTLVVNIDGKWVDVVNAPAAR